MVDLGDAVPIDHEDLAQAALDAQSKMQDIENERAQRDQLARDARGKERAETLTFEQCAIYRHLSDRERYLRVYGTHEDRMQPEDIERERQRKEREGRHSAALERERAFIGLARRTGKRRRARASAGCAGIGFRFGRRRGGSLPYSPSRRWGRLSTC